MISPEFEVAPPSARQLDSDGLGSFLQRQAKGHTDYALMSDFGFPNASKLPRRREVGQMMQPVNGAGDGSPNRWLSYSHPRVFTA